MLSNDAMRANRYARWASARLLVSRIQTTLLSGGAVVVGTMTKATEYGPKHADWFTASRSGAYVRSGKSRVCIDGCGFRFFVPSAGVAS